MQHWLGIVGSSIGIAGTAALSFDLLRSKSSEESLLQFKQLQDELETAAQELMIKVNESVWTLARFISGYLSLLEMEAQMAEEDGELAKPVADDQDLAEIRQFLAGKSKVSIRTFIVGKFVAAQKELPSREDVEKGIRLMRELRAQIEQRFKNAIAVSQKMRRVAIWGVLLVAVGSIAQLLDLLFIG